MEQKPALSSSRHWFERFPRALPVGIFLLTSAVTLFAVTAIENTETKRRSMQLAQTAKVLASALERRADAHDAYLRSGAAFLAAQGEVTEQRFQTYLTQLRLNSDFRGAEGIGWAMRVEPQGLAAAQAAIRRQTGGQNTVRPLPGPEGAAVPVTFFLPDTQVNRSAIGFNMYAEPLRRAAMDQAARLGRPIASGKIVLIQESLRGSDAPGFIIYMPVYTVGSGGKLKGFIYSPFVARSFLASALELENRGDIGVRLYDRSRSPANLLAELPAGEGSGQTRTVPVTIASHHWVLEVEGSRTSRLTSMSLLTLLFGMLVASLLLVLARLITRRSEEDRLALNWFEEQASIRNSLTRELNHRVKNTLANVLSIVSLTRRRATDLDSFASSLEGRIRALSATHDLLTQSEWGTTPIRAVVAAELSPFVQDSERMLDLSGPAVELAPNDALSLGLAMHELATNAAKFGALSVPEGRVAVTWQLITQDLARIEWAERNGPPVPQGVRRRGFGTELIEKIVAHELRNPVDLKFDPEGVRCVLILPVRRPTQFAIRSAPRRADEPR